MNKRFVFLLTSLWLSHAGANETWIGRFESLGPEIPAPWQIQQVDPKIPPTRYRLRQWDGVYAVEAEAESSMALLGRPLTVDLEKTPILCWRWRVDAALQSADMRTKAGDDYAARIYLTFSVPAAQLDFGTRAKLALARSIYGNQLPDAAINYVWDNRLAPETLMNNAYTDRTRMIVVRSGNTDAGRWVAERRDVRADFRRAFGALNGQLNGIAIAVDTDNTKERAHAGFAEFHFVPAGQLCKSE
ncbi:MAG: DUF3047 domain-containing protein [Betaproteobacteria bacterium]|nr:DUF3047 domain-containing protein [Betaproteobacteria bacterium]